MSLGDNIWAPTWDNGISLVSSDPPYFIIRFDALDRRETSIIGGTKINSKRHLSWFGNITGMKMT